MKTHNTILLLFCAAVLTSCSNAKTQPEYQVPTQQTQELAPIYTNDIGEKLLNDRDEGFGRNKTESNIIFPDNIEQITEIGDAAVSFEEVSDRIIHTKAYPEDRSLVHKDTVRALERTFYVISAVYDNGDTVSAERTFWADVRTGDIYLYYDPTTMPYEQYSEYVGEISEDDGRSRLIAIDG